jgi:hypothetical protein
MSAPILDFAAAREARAPAGQEGELFFARDNAKTRQLIMLGLLAFVAMIGAAILDYLPQLFWPGVAGLVILGFIMWASQPEDSGGRPLYELTGHAIILDPAGQRRVVPWTSVTHVREAEGEIILSTVYEKQDCSGCAPQAEDLRLKADAVSATGAEFGSALFAAHKRKLH